MEQITPEIVETLAVARLALRRMGTKPMDRPSALYAHYAHELVNAFAALDDAGAFAALDEAVQSAMAESILAEGAAIDMVRQSNPNVPTDKALQVLHNTWHPETAVSGPGKLERVPGTDTLRPVHEHVFRSPHSDEICYGAEWCTVTYREHRAQASRLPELDEPETAGQEARRMSGADEWSARARAIESIRPTGRRSHGSLAADND